MKLSTPQQKLDELLVQLYKLFMTLDIDDDRREIFEALKIVRQHGMKMVNRAEQARREKK